MTDDEVDVLLAGLRNSAQDYVDCGTHCDLELQAADALTTLRDERDAWKEEAQEQARLNGMGSEREARLESQVKELSKALLQSQQALLDLIGTVMTGT